MIDALTEWVITLPVWLQAPLVALVCALFSFICAGVIVRGLDFFAALYRVFRGQEWGVPWPRRRRLPTDVHRDRSDPRPARYSVVDEQDPS